MLMGVLSPRKGCRGGKAPGTAMALDGFGRFCL